MMRTRLLQLAPVIRKERRSLSIKTASEKITRRFNPLVAKNLVILNEISLRKRVSIEHIEPRFMMSPWERSLEMSILKIQTSFCSQLFQVQLRIIETLG